MTQPKPHYRLKPVTDKLYYLIRSRKFWATVIGITFIIVGPRAGIEGPELTSAVLTIVAYIMGTALEDGLRN
jgi:hypothetical protein